MNAMSFKSHPLFRFFATLRFAIPVLAALATAMIVGTMFESKWGSQFASRAVYHTPWFYVILCCIALSVTLAVVDRLPPKKRLSGFYLIHAGLICILFGSLLTRLLGIDGQIELHPQTPSAQIKVFEPELTLSLGSLRKAYRLPSSISPTSLGDKLQLSPSLGLTLTTYLPYAQARRQWTPTPTPPPPNSLSSHPAPPAEPWYTRWQLKNSHLTQSIELAQNLKEIPSSQTLGPLQFEVVPLPLLQSLKQDPPKGPVALLHLPSGEIRWIRKTHPGSLTSPLRLSFPSLTVHVSTHTREDVGLVFHRVESKNQSWVFIPQFSSAPIRPDLSIDEHSPFRWIGVARLMHQNTVLIAAVSSSDIQLGIGGPKTPFQFLSYSSHQPVPLPWMGFELTLLEQEWAKFPRQVYVPTSPHPKAEYNTPAVLIELDAGSSPTNPNVYWVSEEHPLILPTSEGPLSVRLGNKSLSLPFFITLQKFLLKTDPGTQNPASYESWVTVNDDPKPCRIFMNNPLKKDGYTLYQASYYQDDTGTYHSILSVNKDPGRPVKYAGALILVFGFVLHLLIIYGALPALSRKGSLT
jgi:hypothetical protein